MNTIRTKSTSTLIKSANQNIISKPLIGIRVFITKSY